MADNPTYAVVDMSKKNDRSHLIKGKADSSLPDNNYYAKLDRPRLAVAANEELTSNYSI